MIKISPSSLALFWAVAGFTLAGCQLVRWLMAGQIITNVGLAFSLSLPLFWIYCISGLFLILMIWLYWAHIRWGALWAVALGLIVGGGTSNLTDRLVLDGGAADYWNLWGISTINLADIAITIGIVLAIWQLVRRYGT